MTTDVKVNNVNMFINKLNIYDELINLETLKENFELDEGLGKGFLRISYAKRIPVGNSTININYNRPGIGPIETGVYCNKCSRKGPMLHKSECPSPYDISLFLTFRGFHEKIILEDAIPSNFLTLKNHITERTLTQEIFDSEISLNPGLPIQNGTIDFMKTPDRPSKIPLYPFNVKRGRKKLAQKTLTTEFLNSVIIYYTDGEVNTSIRVSKNGTINLINIPRDPESLSRLKEELIRRINESGAVDLEKFTRLTELESFQLIPDDSYVHSINAQFLLLTEKNVEIDFENLNDLIALVINGKLRETRVTKIETLVSGTQVIILNELIKIIEWTYVLGKISRSNTPTKEYIKFVVIPAPGVKMTGIINRFGTVLLSLSICRNIIEICGDGNTPLSVDLITPTKDTFLTLFKDYRQSLVKKSLKDRGLKEIPTIDGYIGKGRKSRWRKNADGKEYTEDMQPIPYSWKGVCSDPNYLTLDPIGIQGENGLYYPYCSKITKNETDRIQRQIYLRLGFPLGATQRDKELHGLSSVTKDSDPQSGITSRITRDKELGDTVLVKNGDTWETVTIIRKIDKPGNKYIVRVNDTGEVKEVLGSNFKTESRFFRGLLDFNKGELLNCINKYLYRSNFTVNQRGTLLFNRISELNEKRANEELREFFLQLVPVPIIFQELTYYSFKKLSKTHKFIDVPSDSYPFYLVLSKKFNFFINNYGNFLPLEGIDETIPIEETIVLNGYLKLGDNTNEEIGKYIYTIIDLVYYDKELLTEIYTLTERVSFFTERRMLSKLYLLNSIVVLKIPTDTTNVDLVSEVKYASSEENQSKFLFMDQKNINNYIWNPIDDYPDKIELQILSVDNVKNTINFGYEDRSFDETIEKGLRGLKLGFISSYAFFERTDKVLRDLGIKELDYVIIKINRNGFGDIVPNRKISLVKKIPEPTSNYDSVVNLILKKFNPIDKYFFSYDPSWSSLQLID